MIIDSMKNHKLYAATYPGFREAFAFLEKAMAEDLPVGRYEIDGTKVFALVQTYETKPSAAGSFEGHRNYIDLQFILSGVEIIETLDISKAAVKVEYDESKDAAFFENSEKSGTVVLEAGEYGIFFPHDIHKPGRIFGAEPAPVKKIIVKIAV